MCPISLNIYGMKLNEGHLSFGTIIIHFSDKFYQEINFKSHLNSVLINLYKDTVRFPHVPFYLNFCLCLLLQ